MTTPINSVLHVLITDDIEQNREYFADILHKITSDIVIEHAASGEEALKLTENRIRQTQRSYDLIIMDFKMPVMNGEQATNAIRQLEASTNPPVRSIIITWSTSKMSPYAKADDWLPKMTDHRTVKAKLVELGLMIN